MKYAIIGYAQAGKTTFARYLAEATGLKYADSSDWVVRTETKRLHRLKELGVDISELWDNERDRPRRELLIALADAVCDEDPAFLIRQSYQSADIVAGFRRMEEFKHLRNTIGEVCVIFISRDDRPDIQDNFDIPLWAADMKISNNGTKEDLKKLAGKLIPDNPVH